LEALTAFLGGERHNAHDGVSDLRTTVGEAEQYYHALQLRRVPTELYEIPGAAHALMRPSQLAQQSTAIVEWFGRYRSAAGR
jgi:dipeptidyl aminopeptidase/acylaminoacyl peptidase